ncbi:possible peptidoglycan binding protein [Xanthomonas phage Xp15]|uniref:Possible peptidoglycan binding protein n=1 Tax=Xanthomonas phage Xp15 TaxID=322855 RepID=Q52PL6_9CAUD|nr:tail terminator [Xanthomonas phage Xp15]AAX84858.1 possible peptidoglycan binding protein [Xanthomonas phage Xp15]
MSYFQEKLDIENYFKANWPDTPIFYENRTANSTGTWVRLTIQNGDAFQASNGEVSYRHPGVVFVQIFTKKEVGSGEALKLADKVDALFRSKTLGNIQFKVPQVQKVPSTTEWYQVNVSTEFYRGS